MACVWEPSQYCGLCWNGGDQCRRIMFGGELPDLSSCLADTLKVYGPATEAQGEKERDMEEEADIEMPLLRETQDR